MPLRIEDYALIGDGRSAALVGNDGSIDWLCLPRFDAPALFAALLGTPEHGRWRIAPAGGVERVERRYRGDSMVLETVFNTGTGVVRVVDAMPFGRAGSGVTRLVEGVDGNVAMRMDLAIRFDYGSRPPWLRKGPHDVRAVAGPDAAILRAGAEPRIEGDDVVADFEVAAGRSRAFDLAWHPSHEAPPPPIAPERAIPEAESWWRNWSAQGTLSGADRDAVARSLLTLKALIHAPTGGIVAAPTTSLPELIGGGRNWDYRYAWLRDSAFTLEALLAAGHLDEARAWRSWLARTLGGRPSEPRIMYSLDGHTRLDEWAIDWLPGFEGSRPVRVGNAAHRQVQLDVPGEVLDSFDRALRAGLEPDPEADRRVLALVESIEGRWREEDEGIWEIRGRRRHFTHSKVMAWVAFDRALKVADAVGAADAPLDRWRATRDEIHEQVCTFGFDRSRNTFVQFYGSSDLDASLLVIPLVGFLPADDPRVVGTVAAIGRELMADGFVLRYRPDAELEGLSGGEGAFLACSFWLVEALALQGRREEARSLFDRLLATRNDVGLLAEEFDPRAGRLLGNFPQAFSHYALVRAARALGEGG
ncbi:MAG TPA: glycoside hydrolase family 15 protein [Isosphaeraceae bacterium]|jgi:GH15 family glucan-1,4-alpha-glucosidase|nr:glycoside hydrolase family 15 protein [Isosphaeraceae bacterium]